MHAQYIASNNVSRPPLIEYRDVTVMKNQKKLLDSLTVTIQEGEHVAILGPNGAGKSTFIQTIMREHYPLQKEGVRFRVCGSDVWDVSRLRSHFGIVSNDLQYAFTRDITGRDVILSGFFFSIGLYWHEATPEMEQKTNEIIRFLEIGHLADRLVTTLSSGEARRFLIGRALVHDPKTLILDEPTTSLDLYALHIFRATLRKIARAGTGIIMVTHRLSDIIPETTRVILMKDGRFCGDGPKTEILTGERIGGHFGVPVQVREEDGWYYAVGY